MDPMPPSRVSRALALLCMRTFRGYKQEEFAELMNWSRWTVSRREAGDIDLSQNEIDLIEQRLEFKAGQLLRLAEHLEQGLGLARDTLTTTPKGRRA